MHFRMENIIFLYPLPVTACLQISVGHWLKITAATSRHKSTPVTLSHPSMYNLVFRVESASPREGSSQPTEEQRGVGDSDSVVL